MTIRPRSSRTSTTSSRLRCVACITDVGIRTAALLPHFFTVDFGLDTMPEAELRALPGEAIPSGRLAAFFTRWAG